MKIYKTILASLCLTGIILTGAYLTTDATIKIDETKPDIKISSLSKGLVLHQPLDIESLKSATLFGDKTPYNNDGTKKGSVLKFDGGNDYVNCGDNESLEMNNELTMCAWVKSTQAKQGLLLGKSSTIDYRNFNYVFRINANNTIYFINGNGSAWDIVSSTHSLIEQDEWVFICVTYDETTVKFYKNGDLSSNQAYTFGLHPLGGRLGIGKNLNNWFFKGSIGDTRIYSRALEPSEVTTLYQGGSVSGAGLEAHWKMKDKLGDTLTDETANNNDGTLNGYSAAAPDELAAGYGNTNDTGWNTDATPNVFATDRMGQSNRAMSFDGASDYIDCGNIDSLDIANTVTVSAWVKFNSFSTFPIILERQTLQNRFSLYVRDDGQIDGIAGGDSEFTLPNTGGETLEIDTWYHILYIFDKDAGLYAYLNGNPDKSHTGTATPITCITNTTIGVRNNLSSQPLNGSIADVRIYDRALEPAEITSLFQSYRSKIKIQ